MGNGYVGPAQDKVDCNRERSLLMQQIPDELILYDLTRQRLHEALVERLPGETDLEGTVTAYAYWVCTAAGRGGADWEESLREYADIALRRAADESEAERREIPLLRRELLRAHGPVLDVGAGWGRLASLYKSLNLQAVYLEPELLGTQLMWQSGLSRVVQGVGEALPFVDGTFSTTIIGWVLHHHALPDVDAFAILAQAARVTAPGGRLFSIEPLREAFSQEKWTGLLEEAGFQINRVERFFEFSSSHSTEALALAIGTRHPNLSRRQI